MTTVAIDANVAVSLVVPLEYSDRVLQLFGDWRSQAVRFVVPSLWGYEIASALRKAVAANVLMAEEADLAIRDLWALDIQEVQTTIEQHRRALVWADRLGQSVAYDAQYIVVAEEREVELWTADQELVAGAHEAGADWVRWIGETAG